MSSHRINQPDRISVNSFDDPLLAYDPQESAFSITLNTPILDCKAVQLLRATIPQASVNLPDYGLVFWYYRCATGTQPVVPAVAGTLKCIRMLPNTAALVYNGGGTLPIPILNKYLTGGLNGAVPSLISQLNAAATTDNVVYNPYFTSGDITFAISGDPSKIQFTGNNAGFTYCPAGFADPNVLAAIALNNITFPVTGPVIGAAGAYVVPQPQVPYYTLNRRVGFALSGLTTGLYADSGSNPLIANTTGVMITNGLGIPPDSFPNISGTSVVNIYASAAGPGGNSSDPRNPKNLLATVPMTAVLANNNYSGVGMLAHTFKCPPEMYQLQFNMTDDQGQAYLLPDNANVNLELNFIYK